MIKSFVKLLDSWITCENEQKGKDLIVKLISDMMDDRGSIPFVIGLLHLFWDKIVYLEKKIQTKAVILDY